MLGHGDSNSQSQPKLVASLRGIAMSYISSGGGHSVGLTATGEVYCWGRYWLPFSYFFLNVIRRGDSGQLGLGNKSHQSTPKHVPALKGKKIVDVSAGGYHTVAISSMDLATALPIIYIYVLLGEGHLYTWGRGDYGVLGRGDENNQLVPKLVPFGEKMALVSAGFWHNLAVNGVYLLL